MVIFFLFFNFLCRRDRSRTCLVCCHFSFDVAPLFFYYFLTLFYTVYYDKVFRGNYAPLQNGVVVVNDF